MRRALVAALASWSMAAGCATTSGAGAGAASVAAVVGQPAPAFSLPALGGGTVELASYVGKVVLVDFWASWCAPCREELPALERLRREMEPLGAVFVTVNLDSERDAAMAMARQLGVSLPVGLDVDRKVAERWSPPTMPTSYVLDRRGVVRHIHEGYHGGDDDRKFRSELTALLAE